MKGPIMTPERGLRVAGNKQEFFNKIMAATDFTKCQTGLASVQALFNSIWPTMDRLMGDNEVLLAEQSKVLKNHADLDEKYKNLVVEHEELLKKVEDHNESVKENDGSGIKVQKEGNNFV